MAEKLSTFRSSGNFALGYGKYNVGKRDPQDSAYEIAKAILHDCVASQSSSTFTISDISQSLGVTPAAIAGVIFNVW